jgi:hypothetical protein
MRLTTLFVPLLATAALAACVGPRGGSRGPEFVGRPIVVQGSSGGVTTLFLRRDGSVEARYNGKSTAGRWDFRDGMLCYLWRNGTYRECWPHTAPFVPGRTETIHSDRGSVVSVTME